jgi:hypothetical protein
MQRSEGEEEGRRRKRKNNAEEGLQLQKQRSSITTLQISMWMASLVHCVQAEPEIATVFCIYTCDLFIPKDCWYNYSIFHIVVSLLGVLH